MATPLTSSSLAAEHIVWEADREYSRENITIAAGQVLKAGAVLGELTATPGTYVQYDNGGSGGAADAKGVLYAAVDATDGAKKAAISARMCILRKSGLSWKTGQSAGDKTAAYADLAATPRFIIVRDD